MSVVHCRSFDPLQLVLVEPGVVKVKLHQLQSKKKSMDLFFLCA